MTSTTDSPAVDLEAKWIDIIECTIGVYPDRRLNGVAPLARIIVGALADQARALPREGELEPLYPISTDGPNKIGDGRRWLARKLMDSKLTEAEAYEIVAYCPSITDVRAALPPAGEVELRAALNLIVQKVDDLTVTRGEIEHIAMAALTTRRAQTEGSDHG